MNRISVLVVRDSSPIQFAGLDLADRAARVARRAGAETVQMVDDDQPFASAPSKEHRPRAISCAASSNSSPTTRPAKD